MTLDVSARESIVQLLLLSNLFSATESKPSVIESAFLAPAGPTFGSLPTAVRASQATLVKSKNARYRTCTANDGTQSGGLIFPHPGGGSGCSSYNHGGCKIGGQNGL